MALSAIGNNLGRMVNRSFLSKAVGYNKSRYLTSPGSITATIPTRLSSNFSRGDIVTFLGKNEVELGEVVHSKFRPCLIVSANKVIQYTNRLMLAPLSSSPVRLPFEVEFSANQETGLRRVSKVMTNQIFTIDHSKDLIRKLGSAFQYMDKIDQALSLCFEDLQVDDSSLSRGDVVEVQFRNRSFKGIIVSNDLGNKFSRIAMIANTVKNINSNLATNFEVTISINDENILDTFNVKCYSIDTFAQETLKKKGRVTKEDMKKISETLLRALGINKNPKIE